MSLKPQALKPGDMVGIAAPAGPFQPKELEQGIRRLNSLGFKVRFDERVFSRHRYLAGKDQDRAQVINDLFADDEIRAIFCARGGYGSVRLLPYLDLESIRKHPKIFMGSSDITSLLLYFQSRVPLVVFHGPMVAREQIILMTELTRTYLLKTLCSSSPAGILQADGIRSLHPGKAEGILTGGCLSLLVRALGTSEDFDTRGKILFIEDVDEKPYRIDRMLTQLREAGKFEQVRGIVFGTMVNCQSDPDVDYSLTDVILEVMAGIEIPMLYNFPSGHGLEAITLPFGIRAAIDADNASLSILEGAVIE